MSYLISCDLWKGVISVHWTTEAGGHKTHERSSNLFRRSLGLVEWDDCREGSDTESGHDSTNHELVPRCHGSDLNHSSDDYDGAVDLNGLFATELVGEAVTILHQPYVTFFGE